MHDGLLFSVDSKVVYANDNTGRSPATRILQQAAKLISLQTQDNGSQRRKWETNGPISLDDRVEFSHLMAGLPWIFVEGPHRKICPGS